MPAEEEPTWGRSTVETACPLDCPDACSLAVSLERGRITKIDHSPRHAGTNGFICSKVRRFDRRVYGEECLHYPRTSPGALAGICHPMPSTCRSASLRPYRPILNPSRISQDL